MGELITQAELKDVLAYCPETGVLTRYNSKHAGTKDKDGYIIVSIDSVRYKAHRLIWFYMTGKWPDTIDHINRVKDDNRWANLRNVSHQENHKNRPIQANNKSGVAGVCWIKKSCSI